MLVTLFAASYKINDTIKDVVHANARVDERLRDHIEWGENRAEFLQREIDDMRDDLHSSREDLREMRANQIQVLERLREVETRQYNGSGR